MSKALTVPDESRNSTALEEKEKSPRVPKGKKARRDDAAKGIKIAENPDGPPMDDVNLFFPSLRLCLIDPLSRLYLSLLICFVCSCSR